MKERRRLLRVHAESAEDFCHDLGNLAETSMEEIEDIGGGKSERLGSWMHGATSASTSNPKALLRGKPEQREDKQPVLATAAVSP